MSTPSFSKAAHRFINMVTSETFSRMFPSFYEEYFFSPTAYTSHTQLLSLLLCQQYIVLAQRRPAKSNNSATVFEDQSVVLQHLIANIDGLEQTLTVVLFTLMGLEERIASRRLSMMMCYHPRIGCDSPARGVPVEITRKILDLVFPEAPINILYATQLPEFKKLKDFVQLDRPSRTETTCHILRTLMRNTNVFRQGCHDCFIPTLLSCGDTHSVFCASLLIDGFCYRLQPLPIPPPVSFDTESEQAPPSLSPSLRFLLATTNDAQLQRLAFSYCPFLAETKNRFEEFTQTQSSILPRYAFAIRDALEGIQRTSEFAMSNGVC
eukprot:c4366_g1_i1.p1 GENE.c4366_g1_i1~~c4366_g1_i1.p1  ORF type:complete len:323 (+),score=67.17 c4366_g1_i1:71-1039(+)